MRQNGAVQFPSSLTTKGIGEMQPQQQHDHNYSHGSNLYEPNYNYVPGNYVTSEEIIAHYPEGQTVLDANQHPQYNSAKDFWFREFSYEQRKKVIIINAFAFPIISFLVIFVMSLVEGVHLMTALIGSAIPSLALAVALAIVAPLVCRQLNKKIEERNAQIAFCVTHGMNPVEFVPAQYGNLKETYENSFDFSVYDHVDMAQVEQERAAAARAWEQSFEDVDLTSRN